MNGTTEEGNVTSIEDDEPYTPVVVIFWICTLWTLISNTSVLTFFFRNRKKAWTDFTKQTCSMAISDLLVGFSASHMFFMLIAFRKHVSYAYCVTATHLHFSFHLVTLYHVFAICLYRNIKLKSLFETLTATFQPFSATYVKTLSWVCAVLVTLLPMLIWRDDLTKEEQCTTEKVFSNRHKILYIGIVLLVPQCLTNILYLLICLRLGHAIRKTVPVQDSVKVISVQTIANPAFDETDTKPVLIKYGKINNPHKDKDVATTSQDSSRKYLPNTIQSSLSSIDEQPVPTPGMFSSIDNKTNSKTENSKTNNKGYAVDSVVQYKNKTVSFSSTSISNNKKQVVKTLHLETSERSLSLTPISTPIQQDQTRKISNMETIPEEINQDFLPYDAKKPKLSKNVSIAMHTLVYRVRTRYHKKVLKTIGILLLLFNIFTLPLTIGFLVGGPKNLSINIRLIEMALSVVNSGINPVVAVLRIDTLNDSVKKCLSGLRRKFGLCR